jgi:ABC-type glutathione transport system ATPase component
MTTMVEINNLHKTFGSIVAVDGVSFTVGKGEVLGFLGPNGAGKSFGTEWGRKINDDENDHRVSHTDKWDGPYLRS